MWWMGQAGNFWLQPSKCFCVIDRTTKVEWLSLSSVKLSKSPLPLSSSSARAEVLTDWPGLRLNCREEKPEIAAACQLEGSHVCNWNWQWIQTGRVAAKKEKKNNQKSRSRMEERRRLSLSSNLPVLQQLGLLTGGIILTAQSCWLETSWLV